MAADRDSQLAEDEFLASYRERRDSYPKAANTSDVALFAGAGAELQLLLILRGGHPYRGSWALPGGFLELGEADSGQGETLEDCALRELAEETGIRLSADQLVQLGTYSDPGRDPRGRTISTVFVGRLTEAAPAAGGDDAAEARWWPVGTLVSSEAPSLAFDHSAVVADAIAWAGRQGLR